MTTKVEEFETAEDRDRRLAELKERGHNPSKYTNPIPVRWENRFYLTYSPEQRKHKKVKSVETQPSTSP